MSGACEYDPKKAHELSKESKDKRIEILRLVGISLVTIFVAWLQLIQPSWIGQIIITGTVIIGGYPIFKESLYALRKGRVNMELSMVIAIIASLSILEFLPAIVITFFAIMSEFVEGFIVKKGRKNIEALYSLAPRKALVKTESNQTQLLVIEQVNVGNIVLVREGDVIPVDGIILLGSSTVDQSSITGESIPVEKRIGDIVFAGTINLTYLLEVKCEKKSTDTTFAKIIQLVENAETTKAPIQKLSDKMATRLIQVAIGLSILTYLVTQNVVSTLSVIIVAGACGLAVGTPIALLATIGKISKRGIVIKGGLQIENLSHTGTIVFDKTGTLTTGKPVVSQVISIDPSKTPKNILEYAVIIEKNINHPLARAIKDKADQEGILISNESYAISDTISVGRGITRMYNQQRISFGNLEFIDKEINEDNSESASHRISELLKSKRNLFQYLVNEYKDSAGRTLQIVRHQDVDLLQFALTATFLAVDRQLVGAVFFEDSLRNNVKEAITKIKKMKIKVVMLTGDNEKIAKRIAEEVGIDEYHAELLPEDKVSKIEEIVKQNDSQMVVMVGDGVNDAPSLAKAHVGIAMGSGTDVAIETADVVLMTNDLMKIPYLIKSSRQSISAIRQNFFGTLGVDGFGILLAFTGHINPLLAVVIHVSSELVFMVNSARLIIDKRLDGYS